MNTPLLSVIIPLYNCGEYITHCLDSLSKQAVDMEIIIVNDGSTDDSYQVVSSYKENSTLNITIINQKNQGPSIARNTGLSHAKGQYIYMMDADDILLPGALKGIIKCMNDSSAQIARFQIEIVQEENIDYERVNSESCENDFIIRDKFNGIEYLETCKNLAGLTVWRHVISREVIEEFNINFNQELFLSEDYVFMINLLVNKPRVIYLDGVQPYLWLKRKNSSSNKLNNRSLLSLSYLLKEYCKIIAKYYDVLTPIIKSHIKNQITVYYKFLMFTLMKQGRTDDINSQLRILKNLVKPYLENGSDYKTFIVKHPILLRFITFCFSLKRH